MANPSNFDPLKVPVDRIDSHLAPVLSDRWTAQALQQRFAQPPNWRPEIMRERKFMDREPAQAAVLMGLVMRDDPTVLLTQRTEHMSTHAGQVAFAGGKCDAQDADAAATATAEDALHINLDARLREGEEAWPEPNLKLLLEEPPSEAKQRPLEVCHGDRAVNDQPLNLAEVGAVGHVERVAAIDSARRRDADGRLVGEHRPNLHRRGVGP